MQDSSNIRIFGVAGGQGVLPQSCNCTEEICSELLPFFEQVTEKLLKPAWTPISLKIWIEKGLMYGKKLKHFICTSVSFILQFMM